MESKLGRNIVWKENFGRVQGLDRDIQRMKGGQARWALTIEDRIEQLEWTMYIEPFCAALRAVKPGDTLVLAEDSARVDATAECVVVQLPPITAWDASAKAILSILEARPARIFVATDPEMASAAQIIITDLEEWDRARYGIEEVRWSALVKKKAQA
jgi:hypothetical protein